MLWMPDQVRHDGFGTFYEFNINEYVVIIPIFWHNAFFPSYSYPLRSLLGLVSGFFDKEDGQITPRFGSAEGLV